MWFGCGQRKIGLAFSDDLELFLDLVRRELGSRTAEARTGANEIIRLLPRKIGRYGLLDIIHHSKMDSRTVTDKLWDLAWQGRITNDAFATLRQGIVTDFAPFPLKKEGRAGLPDRPLTAGRPPDRYSETGTPWTLKGSIKIPSRKPNWSKTGFASSSGATASFSGSWWRANCRCSSGPGYSRPCGSWSFPARSVRTFFSGHSGRAIHLDRGLPVLKRTPVGGPRLLAECRRPGLALRD